MVVAVAVDVVVVERTLIADFAVVDFVDFAVVVDWRRKRRREFSKRWLPFEVS